MGMDRDTRTNILISIRIQLHSTAIPRNRFPKAPHDRIWSYVQDCMGFLFVLYDLCLYDF